TVSLSAELPRGADVVILPDNDEPGRKHAKQVAQALYGIAASIKVVELPGLPPKGDVTDWIWDGGTREQLEALIEAALGWSLQEQTREHAHQWQNGQAPTKAARQLRSTQLATVMPEKVDWLWKPYVPAGRPVAIEGDPGVGKSSFIMKLIAHLTT